MRTALAASLLACLVVVTSAAASRTPTGAESKAIRSAIRGYIAMPGSPAAKDNRVVTVRISTLDHRYAAARLNSKSAGPSDIVLHASMGTWFVEQFGSSLSCEAGPKAVLADLKIGCTPPGATAWVDNCGPLVSTPKSVTLACGDGNYSLAGLRWQGWGHVTATATGKAQANDCTPNCAAGHFHSYAVSVVATRVRACGRARIYTRLTVVYAGKRPVGIGRRDSHMLSC